VGIDGIFTTADGGVTWVNRGFGTAGGYLWTVSCPSVSTCVAAGRDSLIATTDGGTTWVSETPPPSVAFGFLVDVSCASTTSCVAVASGDPGIPGSAAIIATTDGGATWTTQTIPNGVYSPLAVSCASPSPCTAVGENQQSGGVIISTR
jgi:photosystem II stability/assembly factor-like uncharacterized protein